MLSNLFPEANLTFVSISDKNITTIENYRLYLDAKIPNQMLENPTQKHIKRIIHYNQMGLQVDKGSLTFKYCLRIIYHINSKKIETLYNYLSIRGKNTKHLTKIQYSFITFKNCELP